VEVRDIRGPAELRACQALQRRTWGITEDGYVVPVATMAAAQKVGGLVLGAFDEAGALIGFTFAFLGRLDGALVLYSQLAAVDPNAQGRGIGRVLKFAQRDFARAAGLASVVWAFDPLQPSNARFNMGVLGATSRLYEVDLYGSRTDALNAGLATDRLIAEWPVAGASTPGEDDWPEAQDLIAIDATGVPSGSCLPHGERARIEIPADLARVKRTPELAQAWQHHVRAAFQHAFAAGFTAVGFSRANPDRPRYLLTRRA
jgi:predicted GNAT superfamily acetyltransferase